MIKTLRRKILLITSLSVGLVLAGLVLGLNILNYYQVIHEADQTLSYLAQNEGRFPLIHDKDKPRRPEEKFDTRFFSVLFDENQTVQQLDLKQIFAVNQTQAVDYATDIYQSQKDKGTLNNYRYLRVEKNNETRILFVDIERGLNGFYTFLTNSLILSLFGLSSVILLAFTFSRILLKPVEEAYLKQKRFITDASHELKTPLTIIKANMEVLGFTHSDNKWIDSTNHQADRLSEMVQDLLFLAKMEEDITYPNQTLNIKDILEEVIDDHQPMISESFNFITSIQDVYLEANYELIKRLFNTLVENALQYGLAHEEINISLLYDKSNKTHFKISNQANLSGPGEFNDYLDRFNKKDASRNQAYGGSGIGLSIAQSIVNHYHGTIKAYSKDGKTFTISIKL